MIRPLRNATPALLLASPTMPGAIETAALAQSQAPAAAQPLPSVPAPTPAPVANWRRDTADELLRYMEAIGAAGLDPASYGPEPLRAALMTGNDNAITTVANDIFLKLAADLSGGSVRGRSRVDWHMPDSGLD